MVNQATELFVKIQARQQSLEAGLIALKLRIFSSDIAAKAIAQALNLTDEEATQLIARSVAYKH